MDAYQLRETVCELDAGILSITMNRPEKRNALSTILLAEMIYLLQEAGARDDVRVVVLRGAGKGFCPGDDLAGMGDLPADFQHALRYPVSHPALQQCLRELPKPVVAAIHGFAFGVGLDVAMACDFRIVTNDAILRDQRVIERGMHAVTGCAWFQPRAIGVARAFEFLVLGEPLTGAQAADLGMVTRAVPEARLDDTVSAIARKLAEGPTKAIGLMKQQIYRGLEMSLAQFHEFAAPLLTEVEIRDRREGIQAFLEKRAPRFTGH